jgi:hypothetical protein
MITMASSQPLLSRFYERIGVSEGYQTKLEKVHDVRTLEDLLLMVRGRSGQQQIGSCHKRLLAAMEYLSQEKKRKPDLSLETIVEQSVLTTDDWWELHLLQWNRVHTIEMLPRTFDPPTPQDDAGKDEDDDASWSVQIPSFLENDSGEHRGQSGEMDLALEGTTGRTIAARSKWNWFCLAPMLQFLSPPRCFDTCTLINAKGLNGSLEDSLMTELEVSRALQNRLLRTQKMTTLTIKTLFFIIGCLGDEMGWVRRRNTEN